MSLTLTRRHNVDRFGYLIPTQYGNLPMVGAVATYRPGEGRFGGAVAVEEGTTNLIPSERLRFEGWVAYLGAEVTVTQGYGIPGVTPDGATRIQTVGGTAPVKYYIARSSDPGNPASLSVWVYNIGQKTVRVMGNAIPGTTNVAPGEIRRCTLSTSSVGSGERQIQFCALEANDSLDFIAYQPQIEAKPFPTSFVDGTRAAGVLRYSASGIINPDAGTIAFWYRPEFDLSLIQDQNTSPKLIQVGDYHQNGSFTLWHFFDPGRLDLYVRGQDATEWTASGIVSPSDTGFARSKWSYVAVTWDGLNWAVYVDGRRVLSVTSSQPLGRIDSDIWQFAHGSPKYSQLFDELLILPYAASEEEIASWYEAQGLLPPHPQASLQWDRQTVRPAQMVKL